MEDRRAPVREIVEPLLEWYGVCRRELPWRSDPTPYHVWLSEIMLQQTRIAAALEYYRRFLAALPTISALAEADEDALMKLWQGLGYYSRARNLQKAARVIVERHGGEFPRRYEDIRALPGVGDYTAGAISAIAFGVPRPAVDGNVLRVLARLLGDDTDIARPEAKAAAEALLAPVIPAGRAGDFDQALMELGALVCLPNGAPLCADCPLSHLCQAFRTGRTDTLPVKSAKKPRAVRQLNVWLLYRGDRVALRRRSPKGLLAGLWEFPNGEEADLPERWGLRVRDVQGAGAGKHIFTHVEWHMTGFSAEAESDDLPRGWVWADADELRRVYALPSAFRVFLERAAERLGTNRAKQ